MTATNAHMEILYYHVDAFTGELFAGNPAGVCILSRFPADALMQNIAAENRHSQTAFVVSRGGPDFDLRWFTPKMEDDLCGHATLASAHVLLHRGHTSWPVRFHTRSGVLAVACHEDTYIMDFPARPAERSEPPAQMLPALGLKGVEVLKSRDYLVVVDSPQQVKSISPDLRALSSPEMGLSGVIVTAPGEGDVDYVVRFFAPAVGIDEDPVSGSINCTLVPYWAARLGKRQLYAHQLSARGGQLWCKLAGDRVTIAGKARLYLQGTIEVRS